MNTEINYKLICEFFINGLIYMLTNNIICDIVLIQYYTAYNIKDSYSMIRKTEMEGTE